MNMRPVIFRVAGVMFEGRQAYLALINPGDPCKAVREEMQDV